MLGRPSTVEHSLANRLGIRLAILGILAALAARLFQLQVLEHAAYAAQADANRLREVAILAPRGLIFDRNGTLLARNRPSFQLAVVPGELPDDDVETPDLDEEFEALMDILVAMEIHRDPEAAVRMQRRFFRVFGYADFLAALQSRDIPVTFLEEPSADGARLPDIDVPLPVEGLAALIQTRVHQRQQGNASAPIPILSYVDRADVFRIAEQRYRLPGIQVLESAVREYVYGEVASHVLGFLGPIPVELAEAYAQDDYDANEEVGLSGIEALYQNNLRGQPGIQSIEVDIFGQRRRTIGDVQAPVPGQDIQLTMDVNLQQAMYNTLLEMVIRKESDNAAAIALNPQSGQVLGMVSLPSFDNNVFSEGLGQAYARIVQDERRPLINYAIGGLYPPGSTFKIVTALAGLEEGVINASSVIADNGPIYLPNRFAPDDPAQAQEFVSWNHHQGFNHGPLNLRRAIALSNDIFFYYVGGGYPGSFLGLEQEELAAWARRLGYGQLSGLDLPGEVRFPVPNDQWKRINWASNWVTGDSYNMAIGQGYILATPLQVLQSLVPVVNGGTLYQPQMVLNIVDPLTGQVQEFTPRVTRVLDVNPAALETIRLGMRDAVNAGHGTATRGTIDGVVVAGKTGTAEFCEYDPEIQDCIRDEDGNLLTHASYLAFAPFNNPEIAVMVFVYRGGEGSEAAVPVATRILDAYFTLKGATASAATP